MSIRPIAQSSIHRICTGQIIDGIAMAVKELIENSIDAGATMIEIRIKDHGGDSVEVADNGCGVDPENYANIARLHCTSKLQAFEDLTSLKSFGFRGEALSALAALSELTITTRTAKQAKATKLTFDHHGELQSQEATNGRPGTTVCFKDFYKNIPVRYATMHQNIKKEFARLQFIIQCYAIICTKIKFIVFHQTKKGNRVRILQTNGTSLKDNISSVFGPRLVQSMVEIKDQNEICSLNGYVLAGDSFTKTGNNTWKPTAGSQCQFLFINKRPVDIPKLSKAIAEVYKSFFGKTGQQNQPPPPAYVINFDLPTDSYDINITPDKRTVMIHQENEIIEIVQHLLHRVIEPAQGAYSVNQGDDEDQEHEDILGVDDEKKPETKGSKEEKNKTNDTSKGKDKNDKTSEKEKETNSTRNSGEIKALSPAEERASMINSLKQKMKKSDEPRKNGRSSDEPKSDSIVESMVNEDKKKKSKKDKLTLNSDGDLSDSIYNNVKDKSPTSAKSKKQLKMSAAALLADSEDGSEDVISKFLKLSDSQNLDIKQLHESESMDLSGFQSEGDSGEVIDDLSKLEDDEQVARAEQAKRAKQQLLLKTAVTGPSPFFAKPAAQNKQVDKSQDEEEDLLKNPPVMSIEALNKGTKKSKAFPVKLRASNGEGSEESLPIEASEYAAFKTGNVKPAKFKIDSSATSEMESEEEPPVVNLFRQNKLKNSSDSASNELKKSRQEERIKMIEQLKSKKKGSVNNNNNTNVNNNQPLNLSATLTDSTSIKAKATAKDLKKSSDNNEPSCSHDHEHDDDHGKEVEVIEFTDGNSEMMKKHFDYETNNNDDESDEMNATNQNEFKTNGYTLDKKGRPVVDFDISYYTEKFKEKQRQARRNTKKKAKEMPARKFFTRMTNSSSDEIERELTKQITKPDFEKMQIIGQFNLGFIIVKLGNDLFMVDQHAADEKYNFEVLQTTTKMNLQRMLKPMDLELSPVDEMIVMDNLEVFRANGFDFQVDEEARPTQRLKLIAYPFSKNTEFGVQDVHEMIEQLKEQPGKMVRLSRVSAMFASRACRKSVMVGTPLNKDQMKKIVKHMGTMKAPWNCPHGRPTMRHLVDLNFLPGTAKPAPKSKQKSAFPIRPASDSTGSDSMDEDEDFMLGRSKRKRDPMEDSEEDDLRDNSKRRRRM